MGFLRKWELGKIERKFATRHNIYNRKTLSSGKKGWGREQGVKGIESKSSDPLVPLTNTAHQHRGEGGD